jgi:hypothetical protein
MYFYGTSLQVRTISRREACQPRRCSACCTRCMIALGCLSASDSGIESRPHPGPGNTTAVLHDEWSGRGRIPAGAMCRAGLRHLGSVRNLSWACRQYTCTPVPPHSGVTNIYQPAALTSIVWRTWTVALQFANCSKFNGPFFDVHASPLANMFL